MDKKDEMFRKALEGKKIPILVLDNKWHRLFTGAAVTAEIKNLEARLNELLKRQAKVNSESKDIRKIKKKLMDEIVIIADSLLKDPDSKKLSKDMEEHKRLVEECNEKLDDYEEEMLELPREIDKTNKKLMTASMDICYKKIQENAKEINAIGDWITQVRRELKKKIIRKQEKEAENNNLYSYMHDIFGADVIELFDIKYDLNSYKEKPEKENVKKDAPES